MTAKRERRCLVVFEQKITPKGVPPRLRGLARRICASSLKQTLDDIDNEAARIERGNSRIPELNRFSAHAALRPEPAKHRNAPEVDLEQPEKRQRRGRGGQEHSSPGGAAVPAAEKTGSLSAAAGRAQGRGPFALGARAMGALQRLQRSNAEAGGLWKASLANSVRV